MQKGFQFDLNYCTGCQACQIACIIENQLEPPNNWRQLNTFNEKHYPGIPLFHLTVACNHCLDPACLKYCPALAYSKDGLTGAVTINQDHCIGCKYCSWVCPFDAPVFNHSLNVMEKCTFCDHRLKNGFEPACVSLCPMGALKLIDLNGITPSNDIPGFPYSELEPAVEFIPLKEGQQFPEQAVSPIRNSFIEVFNKSFEKIPNKISLQFEWTLIVFTLTAAILTSWFTSSLLTRLPINQYLFVSWGFAAMGLSAVHLGKKTLALRSILNWKNSWLSREIIFYSGFMGLSIGYFFVFDNSEILGRLTALTGFISLFSIDKLYQVIPRTKPVKLHSAEITLTGIFLLGIFFGSIAAFLIIGLFKAGLYIHRKFDHSNIDRLINLLLSILRLGLGFIIPCFLILLDFPGSYTIAVALIISGELIDRIEFYLELDIITPQKQMEVDFRKRLQAN